MKYYDYKKAKSIIDSQSEVVSASLGMHEDWFWTAETVWENGKYINAHFDNLEQNDKFKLGGTNGSTWATPTLQLIFKSGKEVMLACFVGESNVADSHKEILSELVAGGCLSAPVQKNITPLL